MVCLDFFISTLLPCQDFPSSLIQSISLSLHFPLIFFNLVKMKYTLALLASVASVFAQVPAAMSSAMGAAPTMTGGSAASITDMNAPAFSTPASLAAEMSQADCVTGAYVSSLKVHCCKTANFSSP
jgi:hypothetical protein